MIDYPSIEDMQKHAFPEVPKDERYLGKHPLPKTIQCNTCYREHSHSEIILVFAHDLPVILFMCHCGSSLGCPVDTNKHFFGAELEKMRTKWAKKDEEEELCEDIDELLEEEDFKNTEELEFSEELM